MQVSEEPPSTLDAAQIRMIFIALMTGMTLSALDGTIVNTALLTIVSDLGGLSSYAWVGTAYLLTSTISTILMGKLSDLFGRRRLYLIAMVTFLVGSAACGLAGSMVELVLARGLQGVGGGGLIALTFATIGDMVPPRDRGRYSGMMTSVFAVSSVVGPLLGGLIVEHSSWRLIFWVNVPLGAVAFGVAFRVMHVPFERRKRHVDYGGAALLSAGVTCVLLGVAWAPDTYGWSAPPTVALLVAGSALLVGFGSWERRVEEPIIPLHLFGDPLIRSMLIAGSAISVCLYAANAFLPLFLQAVTGVSPTRSGLLLAPIVLGILVSASVAGRVIQRTGRYRRMSLFGFSLAVVAAVGLAQLGQGNVRLAIMIASMAVLGLASGIINPITTIAIQNAVDPTEIGVASSLSMFSRSLFATVGTAAFGTLMNSKLNDRIDPSLIRQPRAIRELPIEQRLDVLDALSDAIRSIFVWCIPLAFVGLAAAYAAKERALRTSSPLEDRQVEAHSTSSAALAH